jgi:uncharacterized protein YbbK (DUF523 family)
MLKRGKLIPICPEVLGGFPTPRPDARTTGDGADVLDGKERVLESDGTDVTKKFIKGAQEVLRFAKKVGIKEAILKARSPSCGCGKIWVNGRLIDGDGVLTALLKRNGIKVITEEEI